MKPLLLLALLVPLVDSFSFVRHYVPGQSYRYEIRERSQGSDREQVAVSKHTVMARDGVPYERIEWVSLSDSLEGDLTALTRDVPPAEISLRPGADFQFTKPAGNPRMMGAVTDLITFFTAVSPQMGVTVVKRVGETYVRPEVVIGDFADGKEFLIGRSCNGVAITLQALDAQTATYQTVLQPPDRGCPALSRDWMKAPVCGDTGNTFEMIRRQAPGFVAAWGCEKITIVSRVSRKTGAIVGAEMDNQLTWKMKFCMDEPLTQCSALPDVTKRRFVTLHQLP
jgi:hypothetical protein